MSDNGDDGWDGRIIYWTLVFLALLAGTYLTYEWLRQ